MTVRCFAMMLLAAPVADGGELRFLNGDGGPLPAHLQPVADAFASATADFASDAARGALAESIIRWANTHDHPVFFASVEAPDARGITRVLLTDGKVGSVSIEGGDHYSVERLTNGLRLKSGEPLNGRALQAELDWLQRNPFHHARLAAAPGATAETADIAFTLSSDRPVSFLAAYDNQGVAPLGASRFRTAFQWGNAFGLDQQLALQVMTGDDPDEYRTIAGEWVVPLPWRHELRLTGAWAATRSTSGADSEAVDTDGSVRAASIRYAAPFRLTKTQTGEIYAGFDYRKFDTDLTFGGSSTFASAVEVGAFVFGASWKRLTARRSDFASLELVWSPGDLFPGADDESYHEINPEADAEYLLLRGSWQSRRVLAGDWQWLNKAGGQAASGPLLPSEDYNIAGATTVRGYRERSVRGRHALTFSTEILTPSLPVPAAWKSRGLAWQLSAFADGGWAASSTGEPDAWLAGAGLGLRARAGEHFFLSADVACPLHDAGDSGGPRLHVTAQLTF